MNEVSLGKFDACPVANYCKVTSGELAPDCGTVSGHMFPLTMTMNGCLRALHGAQRELEQNPIRYRTPLYLAWSAHDLGMAARTDQEAEGHFAKSELLARELLEVTDIAYGHIMSTALLHAYQPAYRMLRKGQMITSQQHNTLVNDLCNIDDQLKSAPMHVGLESEHFKEQGHRPCFSDDAYRLGCRVKLMAHLIGLREGVVLYPASPREQVSSYPDWAKGKELGIDHGQRHDMYQVLDQTTKLPIKVTFSKSSFKPGYDTTVLYLNYRNLVRQSLNYLRLSEGRQGTLEEVGSSEVATSILDWLKHQMRGEELPYLQKTVLDALGIQFRTKLKKHTKSMQYIEGESS